ncbi:carboxypeptidase-like regulatory domain-containing protein [Sungkyunkwania multivorans]|uniref:Carboxypeptidase-like regulatory domain-containing protein n=1 Tax=Sungkyunkwania multivorans TaxID=1173618 RepID=A0ABW3CWU3_9FLAO
MRPIIFTSFRHTISVQLSTLFLAALLLGFQNVKAAFFQQEESQNYEQYKGVVKDSESKDILVFATIAIEGTNISVITNTEGEFLLKVPSSMTDARVRISHLGYDDKIIPLSELKSSNNKIYLDIAVTELSEVEISMPKDAAEVVRKALSKKGDNYLGDHSIMTAFYRESIKKRRRNVSLSEAVVNIYKQPYSSSRKDVMKLYKARKSTDYSRLDTIALKFRGGPFNTLYIDFMKYPEFMFENGQLDYYDFSFGRTTLINEKPVYVINFKQRPDISLPLFYGKLYIDANTYALTSAIYNLNVENRKEASEIFVRKKPARAEVYPTQAAYRVDYRQNDGKWYYGYSNVQMVFKVKWKNKLFSSTYAISGEMAITDWKKNTAKEFVQPRERLRPSVVLSDEVSGFSDPNFWGDYNVIEPEKSIETAINKIRRKLRRIKS